MKPPRRSRRTLSGEDAWLWGEIAKLVTPLRAKAVLAKAVLAKAKPVKAEPAKAEPAKPEPAKTKRFTKTSAPLSAAAPTVRPVAASLPAVIATPSPKRPVKLADLAPAPAPARPQPSLHPPKPLAPGLERKERRALQRGTLPIEGRIDLHGLYQAEAHAALIGFIARSRAAGHARVLVVTGKSSEDREIFSERGVLRRSVPHWLRGPDLRGIVLGFEEASRQHGGAGALYVRLKRR